VTEEALGLIAERLGLPVTVLAAARRKKKEKEFHPSPPGYPPQICFRKSHFLLTFSSRREEKK